MVKALLRMSLILSLLAPAMLTAAPLAQPDLRILLDIHGNTTGTDGPPSGTERIALYQGGAVLYEAKVFTGDCDITTLALGPGLPSALKAVRRALRTGQVSAQKDCGLGFQFGTNIEYQVSWRGLDARTNTFKFGTYYQSNCPSGVALIKKAYEDYASAVLSDPQTKVIRSNSCSE